MITIGIYKDQNVTVPVEDNMFWKIINRRTELVVDPTKEVTENSLRFATFNKNILFKRDINGAELLITSKNEKTTLVTIPMKEVEITGISIEEDPLKKTYYDDGSLSFIPRDSVLISFSHQGSSQDEICGFMSSYVNDLLLQKFPRNRVVKGLNSFSIADPDLVYQSLVPTGPWTKVEQDHRKICGFDINQNESGYHEFMYITMNHDKNEHVEALSPIIPTVIYTRVGKRITVLENTGFRDNGVEYSSEQFISDMIEAFKNEYPNEEIFEEK